MTKSTMKTLLALTGGAAMLIAAGTRTASATEVGIQRPIGLGLVAGSAPGLTAKIWTRPSNAVDLGFGFGLGTFACSDRFNPCGERSSFNADYLWQSRHSDRDVLSLHLGLGARFWFWNYGGGPNDLQVAARLPLGLDLFVFQWLEAYAEIAPSLAFVPNGFFFEGALGARIYL
jgi:hypothetical protein